MLALASIVMFQNFSASSPEVKSIIGFSENFLEDTPICFINANSEFYCADDDMNFVLQSKSSQKLLSATSFREDSYDSYSCFVTANKDVSCALYKDQSSKVFRYLIPIKNVDQVTLVQEFFSPSHFVACALNNNSEVYCWKDPSGKDIYKTNAQSLKKINQIQLLGDVAFDPILFYRDQSGDIFNLDLSNKSDRPSKILTGIKKIYSYQASNGTGSLIYGLTSKGAAVIVEGDRPSSIDKLNLAQLGTGLSQVVYNDRNGCGLISGTVTCYSDLSRNGSIKNFYRPILPNDIISIVSNGKDYCANRPNGDIYCWNGYSIPTNPVLRVAGAGSILPVSDLVAYPDVYGSPSVYMRWKNNSSKQTAIEILRSEDGVSFSSLALLNAQQGDYRDLTVSYGKKYFYKVISIEDDGKSEPNPVETSVLTQQFQVTFFCKTDSSVKNDPFYSVKIVLKQNESTLQSSLTTYDVRRQDPKGWSVFKAETSGPAITSDQDELSFSVRVRGLDLKTQTRRGAGLSGRLKFGVKEKVAMNLDGRNILFDCNSRLAE